MTFGRMVGDKRQGWALFAVMGVLLLAGVAGSAIGTILILGGLQYFPALALGPIVEHFLMLDGISF